MYMTRDVFYLQHKKVKIVLRVLDIEARNKISAKPKFL